jgi:hypothetical protein
VRCRDAGRDGDGVEGVGRRDEDEGEWKDKDSRSG